MALLLWLEKNKTDYKALRQADNIEHQLPFSTERKYMATIVKRGSERVLFVKGAPEIVAKFCDIDDARRNEIRERLTGYQNQAMRTLAFAYKVLGNGDDIDTAKLTPDAHLTFQAVAAISDPIRPDVPAAVKECIDAGITVKIVTGDTSATAIEIARQIGIWDADTPAEAQITGPDFAALSDDEAFNRVMKLKVMSRARPTDKQRLVNLLQKHDAVVAVTGDGTNDAPALNHAHVGLSLGSGTSVAKEASDMTLIDDSFRSIVNAVMWGRSLYRNIQRFLFFQLVVNVTALLLVLCGSVIGTEMPLTVTQILWVNIIMDTFAALALASLPPSEEVMKENRASAPTLSSHAAWPRASCSAAWHSLPCCSHCSCTVCRAVPTFIYMNSRYSSPRLSCCSSGICSTPSRSALTIRHSTTSSTTTVCCSSCCSSLQASGSS